MRTVFYSILFLILAFLPSSASAQPITNNLFNLLLDPLEIPIPSPTLDEMCEAIDARIRTMRNRLNSVEEGRGGRRRTEYMFVGHHCYEELENLRFLQTYLGCY